LSQTRHSILAFVLKYFLFVSYGMRNYILNGATISSVEMEANDGREGSFYEVASIEAVSPLTTNVESSTAIQFFDEMSSSYVSLQPGLQNKLLHNDSYLASEAAGVFGLQNEDANNVDCMGMPVDSQSWSIVCEGILSVIVGVVGLMGNGATIAVLTRPMFKETFHKLLICLSCFDSLFIGKTVFTQVLT
jgi:hypothetical protein